MNFAFTDDQSILRESVARLLAKSYSLEARQTSIRAERACPDELWKQCGELGLLALPFPEEAGGLGGSIVDVVAVAEKFGEALFFDPYVSSILLAGRALAGARGNDAASAWLTRIVCGEAFGAFAYEEGRGTSDPSQVALRASRSRDGYVLDGEKRHVLGGEQADVLVVAARAEGKSGERGGLVLLAVERDTPGVTLTPFPTIDGLRAAHVRFDGAVVDARSVLAQDAYDRIAELAAYATIALGAMAVGAMGVLLRITAEYAMNRQQFGQPIAMFQAVAHRLADMKIAYTKARATLLYTTALAEAGKAGARDVAILKAQTGKLGRAIGESSVQVHGGAGMTDEVAVGHYYKRLLAIDALFGSGEHHLRAVGARAA